MNSLLSAIIDVFSTPAILVALIAILGLALQKKSFSDIISGGLKTFVGFLVLTGGSGIVQDSLAPFSEMFQHAFNTQGIIPNNEAVVAVALTEYGTLSALVMLLGMVFNVIIARFSDFKFIYLTGHATLYMACMIAVILSVSGMSFGMTLLFGGILLGLVNTIMPALCQPFMKDITGADAVALGHTGDIGYALSGWAGKLFAKNKVSTEDINFPQSLVFLRDSTVSIAITMSLVYIIVALFCGPAFIEENLSDGTNYLVYALTEAGSFAAGVFVILAGVRLILNEILPAFKGISEKLVPNSIPALDCPIVYPYAPNAVLIGFLVSFITGVVCMLIMMVTGSTVVLPGVVPHFFCGATAGVFGNSTGGVKGCILGGIINGIIVSFLPLPLLPIMGNLGFAGTSFSDSDYGAVGGFLGLLNQFGGQIAIMVGIIVLLALVIGLSYYFKSKGEINE